MFQKFKGLLLGLLLVLTTAGVSFLPSTENFHPPSAEAAWVTRTQYTGNGVTTDYTIGFPYLATSDIDVYLGESLVDTADYSFPSATILRFDTAPTNGTLITFRRTTDKTVIRTLQFGTTPSTAEFNSILTRSQYLVQESSDASLEGSISQLNSGAWDANGLKITDLANGTNSTDAVNKSQLDGKQTLDATLTALAGVSTSADTLIYATGSDAFSTSSLTTFGRSLIDDAAASNARTTLGLGTISTQNNIGVSDIDATGTPSSSTFLRGDGSWQSAPGTGTVTNVATSGLATGGPITGTGTITVTAGAVSDVSTGTSTTKAVTPDALAGLWEKGTDIASASTLDIPDAEGGFFHVTGTTTITALETRPAGWEVTLVFDGALQITHNATSLINLGSANLTTAAGDTALFRSEGSGNWRMVAFQRKAVFPSPANAVQADQEAATSTTTYVTPGVQKHHPGTAKGWVNFDSTPTVQGSYGTTSVAKNGTGDFTITWSTAFSTANYAISVTCMRSSSNMLSGMVAGNATYGNSVTTTQTAIQCRDDANQLTDPLRVFVIVYGDQ